MQTTTSLTATTSMTSPSARAVERDRYFFGGMAVAFALTVFAGFSRTYYFNDFVAEPFALTPMLHWHGAAFTAWMLLLVAQTMLIAAHRVRVHMRVGIGGALLAVLLVPLGIAVAVERTASGAIGDQGVPPLVFLAVPVFGMLVFGALVGAAVLLRRNSAAHKRLMLLATLELVTAAVSRLPLVENWGPVGFFGVTDLFIVAMIAFDVATRKKVHAATAWGGLFFVASQPLRLVAGGSDAWLQFAAWLTY